MPLDEISKMANVRVVISPNMTARYQCKEIATRIYLPAKNLLTVSYKLVVQCRVCSRLRYLRGNERT